MQVCVCLCVCLPLPTPSWLNATLWLLLNSISSDEALPVKMDVSGTGAHTSANRLVDDPALSYI